LAVAADMLVAVQAAHVAYEGVKLLHLATCPAGLRLGVQGLITLVAMCIPADQTVLIHHLPHG